MNDEFLYLLREEPRPEFSRTLVVGFRDREPLTARSPYLGVFTRAAGRAAAILLTVVAVAACAKAVVSSELYRRAAVYWIVAVHNGPFGRNGVFPGQDDPTEITVIVPRQETGSVPGQAIPLPEWVPPGFRVLQPSPSQGPAGYVTMTWADGRGGMIVYRARDLRTFSDVTEDTGLAGFELRARAGTWEQVDLEGQPAILIQRDWVSHELPDGSTVAAWEAEILALHWVRDDLHLALIASGTELSPPDLIAMAASAN